MGTAPSATKHTPGYNISPDISGTHTEAGRFLGSPGQYMITPERQASILAALQASGSTGDELDRRPGLDYTTIGLRRSELLAEQAELDEEGNPGADEEMDDLDGTQMPPMPRFMALCPVTCLELQRNIVLRHGFAEAQMMVPPMPYAVVYCPTTRLELEKNFLLGHGFSEEQIVNAYGSD
ncbi:hypothetical protein LTR62_003957 [Meristemomyces frigidus]|uniref:Uncharacterized protein n=1 Tax=Meristemomyces frigidus TaxID=1508187 RepID=A0AAN7TF05_9PEZI|nr:hypothetical protein LTR62_003957 [Meristemomyces frigidus]